MSNNNSNNNSNNSNNSNNNNNNSNNNNNNNNSNKLDILAKMFKGAPSLRRNGGDATWHFHPSRLNTLIVNAKGVKELVEHYGVPAKALYKTVDIVDADGTKTGTELVPSSLNLARTPSNAVYYDGLVAFLKSPENTTIVKTGD